MLNWRQKALKQVESDSRVAAEVIDREDRTRDLEAVSGETSADLFIYLFKRPVNIQSSEKAEIKPDFTFYCG
jgi:hypothetical protein